MLCMKANAAQDTSAAVCETDMDPRIRRSRQMLHDALSKLLEQKEFDKISIQEIAELSTLNRATFYSHYPDKFTLLQCMIGSRFTALMARRDIRVEGCSGALKALALGVCDFLVELPGANRGDKGQVEGSIQTAIVAVVKRILLDGMTRHAVDGGAVSTEVVASTVAWAIYGAAHTWASQPERCSAEHMAEGIDRLLSPVMHAAAGVG
jgi:AcrR family transcriptional regulator